ncbi:MAG: hypothetical protein AAF529_22595 [Pseudomonadota bacterium]
MSVVLPPEYKLDDMDLPLLIHLHGGGMDRESLTMMLPIWQALWDSCDLPPLVMVSFSSGGGSWYRGPWEEFVVDELPDWSQERFGTTLVLKSTPGAPTVHKMLWDPLRNQAQENPNLARAYACLPPTLEE